MSFERKIIEIQEQEAPPGAARKERPEDLRRRDFLRLIFGGLAAGVVMSGKKKEALAGTPETHGEIYHQGLQEMRRASWSLPREQMYVYTRAKDGAETWKKIKEGNATSAFLPLDELREAGKDSIAALEEFHTHTISTQYPEFADREKARTGELPTLLMPPSFMDVTSVVSFTEKLGREASEKIKSRVADPGGIWEYSVDDKGILFGKISNLHEKLLSFKLGDQDDIKEFIKTNELADEDPRLVFAEILKQKMNFSVATQSLLKKILKLENDLMADKNIAKILEIESAIDRAAKGFRQDAPELRELIARYRAVGVRLAFTPYTAE